MLDDSWLAMSMLTRCAGCGALERAGGCIGESLFARAGGRGGGLSIAPLGWGMTVTVPYSSPTSFTLPALKFNTYYVIYLTVGGSGDVPVYRYIDRVTYLSVGRGGSVQVYRPSNLPDGR